MNSLFLLVIGIVVFALGYRFYAKLLALSAFRLDVDYSTPAHSRADDKDFVAGSRHVVFGHYFAAVAGATTLTGTAVAVIWGWIPAFLWVLVGTTVAAGVYGLGTLWLMTRYGGLGLAGAVRDVAGPRAQLPFFVLAIALLLVMNAVFAWLTAELLTAYPAAALPFWLQVGLALAFGVYLHNRGNRGLVLATVIAVAASLIAVWVLHRTTFAFSGAINIDIHGYSWVSLDATVVWIVLLFVFAYYATSAPVWKLVQPRGYLTAIHVGILILLLFVGVAIMRPPIVAPHFNTDLQAPGAIPWIFVTLTSGAIAGFYLLVAGGITAKQLSRETDARYVGYGTALVEGILALSVILVCTAGFGDKDKWVEFYGSWEGVQSLPRLVDLYLAGCANFVAALGIDRGLAHTFAAAVVAGLIAVTLDAGVRVQKQLLAEVGDCFGIKRLQDEKVLLLVTVGLAAALALYDGRGSGGLRFWPLFGIWNQVLAVVGLLLVGLTLRRQQQPALCVVAPMLFLLIVVTWALLAKLVLWWSAGNWLHFAGGIVLLALEIWLAREALRALRQPVAAPPGA